MRCEPKHIPWVTRATCQRTSWPMSLWKVCPSIWSCPSEPLPLPKALKPISDEELAQGGGLRRNVVLRSVFNDNGDPLTDAPAANALDMPADELNQWQYQTDGTFLADVFSPFQSLGDTKASTNPSMPQKWWLFSVSTCHTTDRFWAA